MDVNQLIYQLRSKVDWHFKLTLLQKFRSEGESKGYTSGWNECLSTLTKSKQIKNILFENEFKKEYEQLEEYICMIKSQKDVVKHIK